MISHIPLEIEPEEGEENLEEFRREQERKMFIDDLNNMEVKQND